MISVSGVSFSYGKTRVLDDVSLDITDGGVTALVGPNGAGKSTLLNLIARLLPLQSGSISVDNLEIGRTSGIELARRLAILPQTQSVAPRLTVSELVQFGRYPHCQGRPGPSDFAKVADAIDQLGLKAHANATLNSLSGGLRQRAFAAMVFAQDTKYLLLDEPLNSLDIASSRSLMRL